MLYTECRQFCLCSSCSLRARQSIELIVIIGRAISKVTLIRYLYAAGYYTVLGDVTADSAIKKISLRILFRELLTQVKLNTRAN